MLKIIIVCENEEIATGTRRYFQEKYSIIPSGCFVTEAFVDGTLAKIREDKLTVHTIIDVDGNVTVRQLQELVDNKVEYYFIPDLAKLNQEIRELRPSSLTRFPLMEERVHSRWRR